MSSILYILAAILVFGLLVAVHELGHFLAAKACGVRVNEFSIGMGPEVWSTEKGETQYSLRALPVGGFCAMEGEDEESDDERSLSRQGFWKKLIIFAAGAGMNLLTGFLILMLIYSGVRISDLLTLKKSSVNLDGRWFRVLKSKTAAGTRLVPIAEKVVPFWEYWMSRDGEYVLQGYATPNISYTCYLHTYFEKILDKIKRLFKINILYV